MMIRKPASAADAIIESARHREQARSSLLYGVQRTPPRQSGTWVSAESVTKRRNPWFAHTAVRITTSARNRTPVLSTSVRVNFTCAPNASSCAGAHKPYFAKHVGGRTGKYVCIAIRSKAGIIWSSCAHADLVSPNCFAPAVALPLMLIRLRTNVSCVEIWRCGALIVMTSVS